MAPVFHRLNAEVDEVQGVPTELNGLLLDGQLDLAPISSIEYARHASSLRILPRMCVSSEGAVDSIQIVSKIPFASIRSIAVTPESATSVVLSKVLLPNAVQVPLEEEADAKLLIGDAHATAAPFVCTKRSSGTVSSKPASRQSSRNVYRPARSRGPNR